MKAALLIWNPHNRDLLADALRGECEVLPRERDLLPRDADLVIVDGPALATSGAQLIASKKAAEPLYLPVLFIASRPDVARTAPQLWDVVDDVITRPLLKRELQARVRALLSARRLSLRLLESRLLYEREHIIADSFQHAALPRDLPAVPGYHFDSIYEPAGDEAQIGGDWYDAVCLNDGRIVISIGDVSGAGLEAAVTMASVRQAIRAVAQVYADPVTMLDAADRMLKQEQPGRIVTAFVGVVDSIAETIIYASAGHPPPLLRTWDNCVVELRSQSLPLGLGIRGDAHNVVAHIPPGSVLCFYTDGLSEVTRDLFEAEERLRTVLRHDAILRSAHPARDVKEGVYDGRSHRDDVAILTLRVTRAGEKEGLYRWHVDTREGERTAAVRARVVDLLASAGAEAPALFAAEMIFSELVGNVVRYAEGHAEIVLDLRSNCAVLHVMDSGTGFTLVPRLPSDLLSERGRGLFLVWKLSEDFNVDVRTGGGAHARAVLPVDLTKYRAWPSRRPLPSLSDPREAKT